MDGFPTLKFNLPLWLHWHGKITLLNGFSSASCVIIVQIGSETDDISGLGPGPDQWSHQHQRDFQDFDKIRDTVSSEQWAACCKYRDIDGDEARYLGTGRDKYKYLMLCSHLCSWAPPALVTRVTRDLWLWPGRGQESGEESRALNIAAIVTKGHPAEIISIYWIINCVLRPLWLLRLLMLLTLGRMMPGIIITRHLLTSFTIIYFSQTQIDRLILWTNSQCFQTIFYF